MRGKGVQGEPPVAIFEEVDEGVLQVIGDPRDEQVEHAADEDVIVELIQRVLIEVHDLEGAFGVFFPRQVNEVLVDVHTGILHLDPPPPQEAVKVARAAAEVQDLPVIQVRRDFEERVIAHELALGRPAERLGPVAELLQVHVVK